LPHETDLEKAKSAEIFYAKYELAKNNPIYQQLKEQWLDKYK
jgi:hypothetical protein